MNRKLIAFIIQAQLVFFSVAPALAVAEFQPREWKKSYGKASRLLDRGKDSEAEDAIKRLLSAAANNTIQRILSYELLAELFEKQGKVSDEEETLRLMFEDMRNTIFPVDVVVFTCLKLGDLNFCLKRYSLSKQYYEKVIPLLNVAYGQESAEMALVLNNLAFVEAEMKQLPLAVEHELQAIDIVETIAGKNSELYGRAAANMADIYERAADLHSAQLWYERAMAAISSSCGDKDPLFRELEESMIRSRSAGKNEVLK